VLLTWELIAAYGLDRRANALVLDCAPAGDPTIQLVHLPEFIDATKRAGRGEDGDWWRFGYGAGDNPIFDRMHEAGALVVGASVDAARAVWSGRVEHAFNAAGGLHHAMPDRASGFCVYDDPAIAIAWLLREGAERVAYVDVDVHHGDGPQAIFWNDPRVLTISIHESGEFLFPGTGWSQERGGPEALGTVINIPVPPGTGDDAWLRELHAVVPEAVRSFDPDVLVTQLGCDSHASDPLADLRLTTVVYKQVYRLLHDLAHEAARGRWVATGGGGYQWARVVPRAWTLAFAEMLGVELDDAIPKEWIRAVRARFGVDPPHTLSDPVPSIAN
jgi:acetoin utilization protein AcuC